MYCIGILFSKLSILVLFIKVFAPSRRGRVYWVNICLTVLNVVFYVAMVITLIFQCVPRAKITIPTLPGQCIDLFMSYLLTAIFNVMSDFFILTFPVWAIWQLQMPNNRKFCSCVSFIAGILYVRSVSRWANNRS